VAKPRTAAPKPDAPGEFTFYRHDTVGAQVADAICRRLKLSNDDRERVVAMVAHHMFWYTPEWTDATVRRFVQRVGAGLLPDLFALREGDVIGRGRGEDPETELRELRVRTERVLSEKQALAIGDLAIGGNDVMAALGVRGGKIIGDTLKALLERVVEDPALNQRDRLLELIPGIAAGLVASKPPQS
jgi:tRNA nucleotidyltransferase (CCA-adding enzyme)